MLLDNISMPLHSGSTKRFDSMLEIMMDRGVDETKVIAFTMHNKVKGISLFNFGVQLLSV